MASDQAKPHGDNLSALNVFYPRGVYMQEKGFYETDYSCMVNPGAQYKSQYCSGYGGHEPGAALQLGYGCPGAITMRAQESIDRMNPAINHSPPKGVFTTVEKVFEEQVLEPKLHELTRPCPCPKESVPTDKKLNLPKPAAVPRYMTEKHPQNVGFYNAPTSYQMDFKAPAGRGNFAPMHLADGEGTGFSKTQSKLVGVGSGDGKPDYSTSYQNDYNHITENRSSVYQK